MALRPPLDTQTTWKLKKSLSLIWYHRQGRKLYFGSHVALYTKEYIKTYAKLHLVVNLRFKTREEMLEPKIKNNRNTNTSTDLRDNAHCITQKTSQGKHP